MSDTDRTIWCFFERKNVLFDVSISPQKFISDLRKIISETLEGNPHPHRLVLWKDNSDGLSQNQDEASLSIIVQLLTSGSEQGVNYDSAAEGEPLFEKPKMDYLVSQFKELNIAPSVFAKPSTFRHVMDENHSGRKVYIQNRPIDFSLVPLALICPIFGHISDDMFTTSPMHFNLETEDFAAARELANMLSMLEQKESTRKMAFRKWLLKTLQDTTNIRFSDNDPNQPRLATRITSALKQDMESDGHVELGDHVLIVTEGKTEHGEASSEPLWRAMAYFRAYYMQERCSHHVGKSCLPAILVTYHGPFIDMSGAIVYPDGSVQVQPLVPAFRVDCYFHDDPQRFLLAGFVSVLRKTFKKLVDFYKPGDNSVSSYPYSSSKDVKSPPDRWFPYRSAYVDKSGDTKDFKYVTRLSDTSFVFLAKTKTKADQDQEIVVKFTRTYSEDVHNLLAAKKFAPSLLAVEGLVGSWKMVVMDYLSSPWTMLSGVKFNELDLDLQKCREQLEQALKIIHQEGFVHGDIRGPNIFVCRAKDSGCVLLQLIDFDHCGKEGVDRYPREWNHTIRHYEAKEAKPMQMGHDTFQVDMLFNGGHVNSSQRGHFVTLINSIV